SSIVCEQQISWFLKNISNLIAAIIENKSDSIMEIKSFISSPEIKKTLEQTKDSDSTAARNYLAPRKEAELMLVGIWENILNIHPVGINEDFFDLGGTSITAI